MLNIGLILLLLGAILIVIEIATPGFFIAVPGTILIIYGLILTAFPWLLENPFVPWIMLFLSFPIGYLTYLIYRKLSPPSPPVTESYEGLIGKTGVVIETVKPYSLEGKVKIDSDTWSATSDVIIEPGKRVIVTGVEGVHLIVKPLKEEEQVNK